MPDDRRFRSVDPQPGRAGRDTRAWTTAAADLSSRISDQERATFTFGFGSGIFQASWFGLVAERPDALDPLPAFRGDTLDPTASDGDLCVQVCAADADTAHHGVRAIVNAARPAVRLRWRQTGFRPPDGTADPRGLFGFRDGTTNLDVTDPRSTSRHLWVSDGPAWMDGGTYLVVRRIRLLLDTWDQVSVGDQETLVGRRRDSNLRLAENPSSHAQLVSAESNGGVRLLRRSYSYDAGVDGNGLQDSGLVFIAYQRDPRRQFVPLQRRLAAADGLNAFSQHLASGVYACPGGIPPGSFIGERLFA